MLKKISFGIIILMLIGKLAGTLSAQVLQAGRPTFPHPEKSLTSGLLYLLTPDQKESRIEALESIQQTGVAPKAGFSMAAAINPMEKGDWHNIGDSLLVWTVLISTPEALGTGLVFENYKLSEHAQIFLYTPDREHIIGAYSSFSNRAGKTFSTHILPGGELIIEYTERIVNGQNTPMMNSHFEISEVIHLFTGLDNILYEKNVPSSNPCHVNINCPEGDDWQIQKRGVAKMIMRQGTSWFLCSGSLVNNTANDGTPYFLTADHCASTASAEDYSVWQFYFNYERPACSNTGTVPNNMVSGSIKLASGPIQGGTDFKLLRLDTDPLPVEWDLFFNGWSLETTPSAAGVSIHHPAGDAKKISTYITPLQNSTWPGAQGAPPGLSGGAWRVRWAETQTSHGVTQGGSSGSPIFNEEGLIVGTLTGGSSNCDNPNNNDYYGKMDKHWTANGANPQSQLAPWLNPSNLNLTFMNGYDPLTFNPYPAPTDVAVNKQEQDIVISWKNPVINNSTAPPVEKYTIYRNGEVIHTHTDFDNLSFTDLNPGPGFFTYYLTTTYTLENQETIESESSKVFGVLFPEACELTIDTWPFTETFMDDQLPTCWVLGSQIQPSWHTQAGYSVNPHTPITPVAGDHFMMIAPTESPKEEWLISPVIDLSELENPRLRFHFAGNYELSPLEVNYELGLYISVNDHVFEPLWVHYSEPSIYTVKNYAWVQKGVDLRDYQGQENIRIAFRFYSDQQDPIALDNIIIQYANRVSVDISPANAGLVHGQGYYSPMEEITLIASSADGYGFVEWLKGNDVVSSELIYSFTMPDNDVDLTAVFASAYKLEVEVFPAGAGTIEGEGYYLGGQVANLKATAHAGYRFVNWNYFGNILSQDAVFDFTMPNANRKIQAFFEESVSVETPAAENTRITISPNPASGQFMLTVPASVAATGDLSVQIFDLQGRQRFFGRHQLHNAETPVSIDVHNLTPGIYLLRISNNNISFTEKLIIRK